MLSDDRERPDRSPEPIAPGWGLVKPFAAALVVFLVLAAFGWLSASFRPTNCSRQLKDAVQVKCIQTALVSFAQTQGSTPDDAH